MPVPVRVVKVIVRTWTSAVRAREAITQMFAGDFDRIRVVYVFDPGSQFNRWVPDWAAEEGVEVRSWAEGMQEPHDLVITASENVPFAELTGPVVVLGHGLGFHKLIPARGSRGVTLSGLVPEPALLAGNVTLLVTHRDQVNQLRSVTPAVEGRTVVTSDTSLAILRASQAPQHIAEYRRHLGTGNRTLVLIASTWGAGSVLRANHQLPARLLAELPMDEYQVALVAHGNHWDQYRSAGLPWRLAGSHAGLVVVEPKYWHAPLAAADLVVSDHGSLSLYAAMIGKPLLIGACGAEEVVPGTPMDELIRVTPRLDMAKALRPQLDNAIATNDPGSAADLTRAVVENPDDKGKATRDHVYAQLGIQPRRDPMDVRAAPPPKAINPHAFKVTGLCSGPTRVTLEWMAHRITPGYAESQEREFHQVVSVAETNPKTYDNASIVLCDDANPGWFTSFDDHPSCLLAATPDGEGNWTVRARLADGGCFRITRTHGAVPSELMPSVLYTLLLAGHPLTGQIDVRVGELCGQVMITQL